MRRRVYAALLAAALSAAAGCRKLEPGALDSVRALRGRAGPAFRPPADGVLTEKQVDLYLKVRRGATGQSGSEAAGAAGVDPEEYSWVRGRLIEALVALDAKRVTDGALDAYVRSIERLREARRAAADPKAAARMDVELVALERERAELRQREAWPPATLANASRVEAHRAEIEPLRP